MYHEAAQKDEALFNRLCPADKQVGGGCCPHRDVNFFYLFNFIYLFDVSLVGLPILANGEIKQCSHST